MIIGYLNVTENWLAILLLKKESIKKLLNCFYFSYKDHIQAIQMAKKGSSLLQQTDDSDHVLDLKYTCKALSSWGFVYHYSKFS